MNLEPTRIALIRNPENNEYINEDMRDADDELTLVWLFFTECVGYDPADFEQTKEDLREGMIGRNSIGTRLNKSKYYIFHELIEGFKEPQFTEEELIELIQKWYELMAAKADKIVFTHDNGKYLIGTE